MPPPRKTAVLLGAGHAHLYAIQRAAEFARQGFALRLVAPGPFWYSGLATGMLGGVYAPEQDQIDVAALVQAGGGSSVAGRAARLEPARRAIVLESGEDRRTRIPGLAWARGVPPQGFPRPAVFGPQPGSPPAALATLVKPSLKTADAPAAGHSRPR